MAENVAIMPSRSSQDTYADDGEHFVSDCIQRCVVPAGQASSIVVNIELRQAWDGAWYPLVAQGGEPNTLTLLSMFGNWLRHAREKPSSFLSSDDQAIASCGVGPRGRPSVVSPRDANVGKGT